MTIKDAALQLKINYSTAKHIIKTHKKDQTSSSNDSDGEKFLAMAPRVEIANGDLGCSDILANSHFNPETPAVDQKRNRMIITLTEPE